MGNSITVTDAGPQQGGQIEEPNGRQCGVELDVEGKRGRCRGCFLCVWPR